MALGSRALGAIRAPHQSVWGENRSEIVIRGNLAKFEQNPNHQEFLLSTRFDFSHADGNLIAVAESPQTYRVQRKLEGQSETMKTQMAETGTILVEAAPRDQIWGIGCGRNNPKAHDPNLWRGRNLLGFALTHVREKLWQDMNIESTNS